MAPKVANRRQRRSERQSPAAEAMTEGAWARDWFLGLPDGPCEVAVGHFCEEAHRGGASLEEAMAQGLAYATRLFTEEVAVPDPWHDERLQSGIRSSLLALRELRA